MMRNTGFDIEINAICAAKSSSFQSSNISLRVGSFNALNYRFFVFIYLDKYLNID
jgi:hypothetical protein